VKGIFAVFLALALPLLVATTRADATSFNWIVDGPVGPLTPEGGGTDVEGLVDAQITLSVIVDEGVYAEALGIFPFAPIASGDITISGSTIPLNNGIHALTIFPSSTGTHYGYSPWYPSVVDNAFWPLSSTLPSGNILTLAHGFYPPDPSFTGGLASPGSPILLSDFPTGDGNYPSYTVAAQLPTAPDYHVISQYVTQFAHYDVTEIGGPAPIPEPATMFLLGSGLIGLAAVGRRKLKRN
jgi:hypothetical protein